MTTTIDRPAGRAAKGSARARPPADAMPGPGGPDDVCCPGSDCDLLPTADAARLALVFKALADPTRVRLLRYVALSHSSTACACHLPGALGISQPTLSFHMRKLREAGLVSRDKRGRWVHYTVQRQAVALVRDYLDLPESSDSCC